MIFDDNMICNLLKLPEGPTVDFKRDQYPFAGGNRDARSNLLKDILAFANTEGTSYILIGIAESNGLATEVIGISGHLDDAKLHQLIGSNINKSVEFTYFPYEVRGKKIGVLKIASQKDRPYFATRDYGKVKSKEVYVRHGSTNGVASPDEIIDMAKERPPQWMLKQLTAMSKGAVISAAQQWREHPIRAQESSSPHQSKTYEVAREFVLNRSRLIDDYPGCIDSYGSLNWVFRDFQAAASECNKVFRLASSSVAGYESLSQAMLRLERCVKCEEQVWKEFLDRAGHPTSPLPREASFNLLVIAELAVLLVDVLDSENFTGDLEYEGRTSVVGGPPVWRSDEWGNWR